MEQSACWPKHAARCFKLEEIFERIKRSVLKNDSNKGGLNITDVECHNKSLKLRQFLRANGSKHSIARIQMYCIEKLGYNVE